jgi:hypothetical protein
LALLGFLSGLVVGDILKHFPLVWAMDREDSIPAHTSVELFHLTKLAFDPLSLF